MATESMGKKYTNKNYDLSAYENLTQYTGLFDKRYLEPFVNGYAFIFITKPELFIFSKNPGTGVDINTDLKRMAFKNMQIDPKFVQYMDTEVLNKTDKLIPYMLSYFTKAEYPSERLMYPSNFLKIFTNNALNFDPQDTLFEQVDAFDTKQGFRMPLPNHRTQSQAQGNLAIQVNETINLDFTKLLDIWTSYIANISDGTFQANPKMIREGMIDYMSSIFYFVLEPDGQTLKYWAKYSGCWPMNTPFGNFKYTRGAHDTITHDVNFAYTVKEDMDPDILAEFNKISLDIIDIGNIEPDTYNYRTIRNSILLNREKLIEAKPTIEKILEDDNHEPVVFIKKGVLSSGQTEEKIDRFELIMPKSTYKTSIQYDVDADSAEGYYGIDPFKE